MIHLCKRLLTETKGATAIEYAMICAVVLLVIITSIGALGSSVANNLYNQIATAM